MGAGGSGRPRFDEKEALKGLRAFDPEVITHVHNHFYPEIYRYARYRLSDPTLAEDLASEVFVRLLESFDGGGGPRKSLRGWLMGTASNLVNDYYRKQYKHQTEALSDGLEADLPGPGKIFEMTEQHDQVRAALAKLTQDQQNVLALRFGAGYSLEDTAQAIGKKVNAVKQLQFRALAALRRHLGEKTH